MNRLALFAAAALLSACIPDPFSTEPYVEIDQDTLEASKDASEEKPISRLTTEDPDVGEVFDLNHPTQLTIRLDANPTTGIWWQDPEFDEEVLKLVSNDYVADPAPEGMVGSGGTTIMIFQTVAPGTTTITSNYSRGGGQVYQRLDITVEVTE